MILLSIKSAMYYLLCLLLSALGIVEFEEVWNPSEMQKDVRNEQTLAFSSLKMTPRNAGKIFFDVPVGKEAIAPSERSEFTVNGSVGSSPATVCLIFLSDAKNKSGFPPKAQNLFIVAQLEPSVNFRL